MAIFQTYQATYSKLCCVLLLAFLFNGCTYNYYYAPNVQNNLRLTKAKEVKGDFGVYHNIGANGFVAHTAYSPIKNLGLQANYYRGNSNDRIKMQEGNLAIGTYYLKKLERGETKTKYLFDPGFLLDAYAGMGIGQNNNLVRDRLRNLSSHTQFNYQKYYIQAGIHFQSFGAFAFGYTFRFFYLDYKKAIATGEIADDFIDDLNILKANDPFLLRENSFKISIGSNKINYYLAANFLSRVKLIRNLFFQSSFQTGIEFSISELFARKKELNLISEPGL